MAWGRAAPLYPKWEQTFGARSLVGILVGEARSRSEDSTSASDCHRRSGRCGVASRRQSADGNGLAGSQRSAADRVATAWFDYSGAASCGTNSGASSLHGCATYGTSDGSTM